jgi:hypothetical protein
MHRCTTARIGRSESACTCRGRYTAVNQVVREQHVRMCKACRNIEAWIEACVSGDRFLSSASHAAHWSRTAASDICNVGLDRGFLVLEWVDGMPFVLELIVKPNKRHRGTGADLVHEAKKMAKQPLHLIARSGVPVLRAAWLHDPMLLKQTRLRAEGRRGVHDGQPRQAKLPAEAAEAPSRRQRTSRLHMRVRYLSGRRLSDVTRVYLYLCCFLGTYARLVDATAARFTGSRTQRPCSTRWRIAPSAPAA